MIKIKRALISCWDKTGLDYLCQTLHRQNVEIISSGGTASFISNLGIPVTPVEEITGYPETLNGRVKTLHPLIHAAILAKRTPEHLRDLEKIGAQPLDLVVVNLYPFVNEAVKKKLPFEQAVEFIDIGGPTLLRGAAKNSDYVVALNDPLQYTAFVSLFEKNNGQIPVEFSRKQARHIFYYTAWYDSQITSYFARSLQEDALLPEKEVLFLEKYQTLRYGENPHQPAAAYRLFGEEAAGLAGAEVLWGKPLSFNNYVDIHAAYALALDLPEIACAIIKHTNPAGAASSTVSLADAFQRALNGDPVSAFGGIVAANRPIDEQTAEYMSKIFFECVVAPDYTPEALEILQKKKNLRLLKMDPAVFLNDQRDVKYLNKTVMIQQSDTIVENPAEWQVVTKRKPSAEELKSLAFAWTVCKHVKSNAIVLVKDTEVYGVGAGQMSRIDSTRIAREKALTAGRTLSDIVLASDAFFPFRDGIDEAVKAGVTAIVQPGGSIRDEEVINAANEHNISMVFTGIRHFRH
jgi:phosphoribosylaminoimidazolecarboxamide formyltransferase/IMP cyclohydrolase